MEAFKTNERMRGQTDGQMHAVNDTGRGVGGKRYLMYIVQSPYYL
jgi:hypothetical protein